MKDIFKEQLEKQETEKEQKDKKEFDMIQAETILDLTKVTNIDEKEFEFDNGNVTRYFYQKGEENALMVPKSAHYAILELIKEYKNQLKSVKIKKEGSGKDTKYTVFPKELSN